MEKSKFITYAHQQNTMPLVVYIEERLFILNHMYLGTDQVKLELSEYLTMVPLPRTFHAVKRPSVHKIRNQHQSRAMTLLPICKYILSISMHIQNLVQFYSFCLKLLSISKIMTSIKGHSSVQICEKCQALIRT